MSIREKIRAYYGKIDDGAPWRYRSWEHCFGFFQSAGEGGLAGRRNDAALQLAFYLASWGMYRGSCFLLQYDYTVHLPVIDRLMDPPFASLWRRDVGSADHDVEVVPTILEAASAVRDAYEPIGRATDTLVTKVLLGTVGCVPACDRLFVRGFTSEGFKFSKLNERFLERIVRFALTHSDALRGEQTRIKDCAGLHYPLMKLVDMYFWQLGFERSGAGE